MKERHYMRYTPIDIMHRVKTNLRHTCACTDHPIRNADMDLEHEINEIDRIMHNLRDVQEDLCEMYSPEEGLRDHIDDMIDDIMHDLDEVHYKMRDRAMIGAGLHNKIMKEVRHEIKHAINEHLTKYHHIYDGYDLKVS